MTNNLTKPLLISLLLLVTPLEVYSRTTDKSESKQITEPEKISQLFIKAEAIRTSDFQEFVEIISQLNASSELLTTEQQHYLTYLQALQLAYQAKFNEVEQVLTELLSANDTSQLIRFRSHNTLLNMFTATKDWQKGLFQVTQLLAMQDKIIEDEYFNISIVTIVMFYNQLGQYELALKYQDKYVEQALTARTACLKERFTIEALIESKQLDNIDKKIAEGIKLCQQANEKVILYVIKFFQGRLALANNKPEAVLSLFLADDENIEATKYPVILSAINTLIAQAYWQLNNVALAKKHAEKAAIYNETLSKTERARDNYQMLYQIYQHQGNFEQALSFHELYAKAALEYENDSLAKFTAYQVANLKVYESNQRSELLDEQNKRLLIEQVLSKKDKENTLLSIIILLFVLGLLLLLSYKNWMDKRLFKIKAEIDELTGINNSVYFLEELTTTVRYAEIHHQEISLILFNLDNFSHINSTYGHAVGNKILREVAQACNNAGRQVDVFARMDSAEFAFMLPGCGTLIAEDIANKFLKIIIALDFSSLGIHSPITASFGVTDAMSSGFNTEDILAHADSARYASQHQGCNQVTVYRP